MKKLTSINPSNQLVVGEVPVSDEASIVEKVQQAQAAKLAWKMLGIEKRVEILKKCFHAFKQREQELARLTTLEMGKTITESVNDLVSDFGYFHYFLKQGPAYIADETTMRNGKNYHRIVYEPRGVAACIVPWNYPFTNFVWSVIPNLLVGNTVIFKHSEECPLMGKLIEEIMNDAGVPPGVFAEVYGDGKVGEFLAEQNVDLIWFTGSSAAGHRLYTIAARKQIKAILEMGGSNPAIVFEDVDIDSLVPKIYKGRFTNCGQVCDAIKRLIVHQSVFPEVVDKISQYINKVKVGDPELPETELGPLVAMRQVELLESQLQESIKEGARVVTGGKRPERLNGAYFLPTLLVNVNKNMRVWREEVFGPVLPVVSFDTEEEAIALANDTNYGLGSVVYSTDMQRAQRVAGRIEAGFVDINGGSHWQPCNPFGGYKRSGMGCEHGRLGFQELCRFKVIAEG